jgi:glycine betaine/choline ABC-type transport system substrate-binding protein
VRPAAASPSRSRRWWLSVAAIVLTACSSGDRAITVGSKNFTEQVVLGEIVAQHLEHRLQQRVDRRLNLGGTLLAHQALTSREIDLYPEYTGTALTAILKQPAASDPAMVLERVRSTYRREFHIEWLDPLGIDNGFAMVVSGELARRENLESLSDAARRSEPWLLGVGYEFEQRPDGLPALEKTYGLRLASSPRSMDLGLLYRALEQNQVTMIAANATDGLLSAMDLKVLADDQRAFPPYELCIAAGEEALRDVPGLREALLELSGKFSNRRMQELNYQVDGLHRPAAQVASEFLQQAGLR